MANRTIYGWEDPLSGQVELSAKPKSVSSRAINRYATRAEAEAEIARRNPRLPLTPTLTVEWEE